MSAPQSPSPQGLTEVNIEAAQAATPAPVARRRDLLGDQAPLAPRSPTETALAELWASTLRLDTVGIEDDFFALGGDSLKAAALFATIERRFARKLPLAILAKGATIAFLAAQLDRPTPSAAASSMLVPIKTRGAKRPLFLVHGMHGYVYFANFVGRHLPADQPLYALQARGIDTDQPPHTNVTDMARDYVSEIRRVQPTGPYVLGGYCAGGIVAVEMAHQLMAAGEDVLMLFLIDPTAQPRVGYVVDTLELPNLPPGDAQAVIEAHRKAIRNMAAAWRDQRFDHADATALERAVKVSLAITQAYFRHPLQPFAGTATFICSEQRAKQAAQSGRQPWSHLAKQGWIAEVPGSTHLSLFLQSGDIVAKAIADRLARLPQA